MDQSPSKMSQMLYYHTKVENVLLVEDMKHNILSVSQMCDKGHKVTFDSQNARYEKKVQ